MGRLLVLVANVLRDLINKSRFAWPRCPDQWLNRAKSDHHGPWPALVCEEVLNAILRLRSGAHHLLGASDDDDDDDDARQQRSFQGRQSSWQDRFVRRGPLIGVFLDTQLPDKVKAISFDFLALYHSIFVSDQQPQNLRT